ncbi:hypothetical protein ANO14919_058130 [Xylariales sp. No.14919]|nr:hypothetical protein ANO14919_058130 [Xylariales sp. No.14919]
MEFPQETSEMAESPVIPLPLTQNIPRHQRAQSVQSVEGLKGPELEKWKSRVPKTGNSPMVPKPLFSSAKCVVEAERTAPTGQAPITITSSAGLPTVAESPMSNTIVSTNANPTPISPSPSLFPMPPPADGVVTSPVGFVSPVSLHPSNSVSSSVYSQSTMGNIRAAPRPRPASSIYSQNTLTTVTATAASSPRTPTMTNWASILPGLPNVGAPFAEMHAPQQPQAPVPMEQVTEESPASQQVQFQIQVPRLRSPSLPQDRGNRRRTISSAGGVSTQGNDRASISNRPLVQSPEPVSYPEMSTAPADYEGSGWPLQKPSVAHSVPQRHYVSRSQGSNLAGAEPHSYHVANKESIGSSTTVTQAAGFDRHEGGPHVASPRVSMADSHTPICGPGEQQRSGWWTDEDDDVEQGRADRFSKFSYAAIGMAEKPGTEAQRRRARNIRTIAGISIFVILVIIGVAVGVTLGRR